MLGEGVGEGWKEPKCGLERGRKDVCVSTAHVVSHDEPMASQSWPGECLGHEAEDGVVS